MKTLLSILTVVMTMAFATFIGLMCPGEYALPTCLYLGLFLSMAEILVIVACD